MNHFIRIDIEASEIELIEAVKVIIDSPLIEVETVTNSTFSFSGAELIDFICVSIGSGASFEVVKVSITYLVEQLKSHLDKKKRVFRVTVNGIAHVIRNERDVNNILYEIIENFEELKR